MSESPQEQHGEPLYNLIISRNIAPLLQVALDLDLFPRLQGKAVTPEEAARLWNMPTPSARELAQYLCYMGLLVYRDGKIANSNLAQTQIVEDEKLRNLIQDVIKQPGPTADELKEKLLDRRPLNWYVMRDEGKSGWQPTYAEMEELLREEGFTDVDRQYNLAVGRRAR